MVTEYNNVRLHINKDIDVDSYIKNAEKDTKKFSLDKNTGEYAKTYSYNRNNIIKCTTNGKFDNVLEIGARKGNMTEFFLDNCSDVVVLERNIRDAFFNVYRNQGKKLDIYIGEYLDVIDEIPDESVEYAICLNPDMDFISQKMLLKKIFCKIKRNGTLIYAVDNKYGIKACFDDKIRIEHMTTEKCLTDALKDIGFNDYEIYYPVPDSIFVFELYTKDNLHKVDFSEYTYYFSDHKHGEIIKMLKSACDDGKILDIVASYVAVCKRK